MLVQSPVMEIPQSPQQHVPQVHYPLRKIFLVPCENLSNVTERVYNYFYGLITITSTM